MLDLMTWSEIIDSLKQEGQLKMVAIFDLVGNKIADTGEALLTNEDAAVILKSLDTATMLTFALVLVGSKFNFINVDTNTLIGKADELIFVARRNRNLLTCALSASNTGISCLATVKKFMDKLKA